MSIKKLFDNKTTSNKNEQATSKKNLFDVAESDRNIEQLSKKQAETVPHVDFSNPSNFATYGSAWLYYKSALKRISDYYPYDGSNAEITEFLNNSLEIERYILKYLYPKTTGYATLSRDGYAVSSISADGYGAPTSFEYIDFKGGPGTGSATSLLMKDLVPNPYNSKNNNSNIYDENIYRTAGLPSTYGRGTRTSNLRANFDDGLTVEFWLKTGSLNPATETNKQVIFDMWNQATDSTGARLLIELTSSHDASGDAQRPFIITAQSGSHSTKAFLSLGQAVLHSSSGDWNHYAIRAFNTGSNFKTQLYVNGQLNDTAVRMPYDLASNIKPTADGLAGWLSSSAGQERSWPYAVESDYSSAETLQGWWRGNSNPASGVSSKEVPDASGNGRHGTATNLPTLDASSPNAYISSNSYDFDGSNDNFDIGTAATWDPLIGAASDLKQMTFAVWINIDTDYVSQAHIFNFGTTIKLDVIKHSGTDKIQFQAGFLGSAGRWRTDNAIPTGEWIHLALTYDASSINNNPIIYVNGAEVAITELVTPSGDFNGIPTHNCFIGTQRTLSDFFHGKMADMAVWNSVLLANEIKSIYSAYLIQTTTHTVSEFNPKNLKGRIGALQTTPPGVSSAAAGSGRLSGSLDEFRFWKIKRTAKEIGDNWFTQVRGGSNTDVHNADLGIYFKFNEGITGDASTDSIVLDYSGRASNGAWTGYSSNSRNTGSAIVSASAAAKEYEDPIIRTNHPHYISLNNDLYQTGSSHDYNNNYSLISHVPGWIQDEQAENENSDLRFITHIMGTYFDKLKLQIKEASKLKHINYTSASFKPYALANHLPQSLGLFTPELFVDATVLEKFMNRNDTKLFESDLEDTKNIIYQNLYNNLTSIYKSKGTEKSIRNIFRCFNVDDNILNLTVTSNNEEFELRNNLTQKLLRKNFVNFNNLDNSTAVVYSRSASFGTLQSDAVSGSIAGHINQDGYGFTYEGNFTFPSYDELAAKSYRDADYNKISLFGFVHPENTADDRSGASTTTHPDDEGSLKIYAVRDKTKSKNAYFELSSDFGSSSVNFTLTSSTFFDVYDNENWNLSVRVRPKKYPYQPFITGSGDSTYEIVFAGYNPKAPGIYDSFRVTTDTTGSWPVNLVRTRKRPYVGADRTNLTGTVNYRSDVFASSVAFWMKYIEDDDLIQHAFDFENVGISGSYKPVSALDTSLQGFNAKNIDTLVLNWNFRNVTGSDSNGNFVVEDFSSGSATEAERQKFGWIGEISKFNYLGYGYGFTANSTNAVSLRTMNNYKFINPEKTISSDMVQLFSDQDVLFPNLRRNEIVPNYVFSLEKSLYDSISQEMLDFFAGAVDFQNIIGRPVNKYRERYKELEKLREIFFRRVKSVSTVEKYIKYYKWIDDSISAIVSQLIPISAEYVEGVSNVIESHVLERNKYRNKLNIIDSDLFWRNYEPYVPPASAGGDLGGLGAGDPSEPTFETADMTSLLSPESSPRPTNKTPGYWKERAERNQFDITSNNTIVDDQREIIRKTIFQRPMQAAYSASLPNLKTIGGVKYQQKRFVLSQKGNPPMHLSIKLDQTNKKKNVIKAGRNPKIEQNYDYTLTSVRPAGPVNKENGVFVPLNVLLGFTSESVERPNFIKASTPDNFIQKQTKIFKVQHGRDWENGLGYKNTKSTFSFPFSVISSSVEVGTGYNKEVVNKVGRNLEITNMHIDSYGPMQEVPLQSPFTNYAVGGHQSRHIPINRGSDSPVNRAEAWRILLGTCGTGSMPSGAIGLVGPDYPPPDYNPPAGTIPYPYTLHEKAYLYRDHIAKRPVNFKNISQKSNNITVLGNFQHQYELLHSFGALNNPRAFIDNQPQLPAQLGTTTATTNVRTFLGRHREAQNHFKFVDDYSISYLTGAANKTIIRNRFSAGGLGPEVMTAGYNDFKSNEYSPYNINGFKNLSVIKPSQGPSGSISEPHGGIPTTSRVVDIHGQDYGLNSHYARHTARFGRDSLHVSAPGTSYEELPGFHKTHRNSLDSFHITYDFTSSIIPDTGLTNDKSLDMNNGVGVCAIIANSNKRQERVFDAAHADSNNDSVLFTYSCWLRTTVNSGQRIFELGRSNSSSPDIIHALEKTSGNELKYYFATTDGHGTFNDSNYKTVDAVMSASGWTHIALTVSGAHGSMPVGGLAGNTSAGRGGGPTVKIYVNGESKDLYFPGTSCHAYWPTSSLNYSNFRGFGTDLTYPTVFFGKINAIAGFEYAGDIDEMSLHSTVLTADEVSTLYNSGAPQNLTQSGIAGSSSLLSWWRMGDHPDDDMDGENSTVTSPFSASNGNIIIDVKNAANLHFTAQRTNTLTVGTSSTSLTGQPPQTRLVEIVSGYPGNTKYDNFYVQHQIPRSDRQYLWLSRSVEDVGNIKYAAYQNTIHDDRMAFRSSSLGLYSTPYWTFVTASQATTGSFFQPTNARLNLIVIDPVDDDTGLMGSNTVELNEDLIGASRSETNPDYLNQLLHKRGSKYGWGWNKFRQYQHPLLLKQKKENELIIRLKNDSNDTLTKFNLHPVSLKGRTMLVNVTGTIFEASPNSKTKQGSATYKVTNTNEDIYFSDRDLNELANIDSRRIYRSYRNLVGFGRQTSEVGLNWILYSQNIFPSTRNEFISGTQRPNYDSNYWRDQRGTDIEINHDLKTSRLDLGIKNVMTNSFGYTYYSQSAWPLDPEPLFLTRTSSYHAHPQITHMDRISPAGELHNHAYRYLVRRNAASPEAKVAAYMKISALYSRPHTLGTRNSVVSPYGPQIHSTGSGRFYSASFLPATQTGQQTHYGNIFGSGEALWEAGTHAGINRLVSGTVTFISAPSQPWWNNYESFKEDLNLKAKGFAVVPEFRISEHVEEYTKIGVKTSDLSGIDPFEIPGTDINSGHTNFYKDYSNSDFLRSFLRISKESLLAAKEIRLSCTGAIRYNAYKGFYPAQRTIDLVSQFSRSFGEALQVSQSATTSERLAAGSRVIKGTPSYAKALTDAVFSPGILFNSIKSGIAVDYPLIHDGTITEYSHYGDDNGGGTDNYALTITGSIGSNTTNGTSKFNLASASSGYHGGQFWDRRLPFEAIIRPKSFLPGYSYMNLEAHPSMSATRFYPGTASMADLGDDIYNLMARNFFGETANFFLDGGELTTLESNTVTNDLRFQDNEVYMARIKLRRSHNGQRFYDFEHDSLDNNVIDGMANGSFGSKTVGIYGMNSGYSTNGCRTYFSASEGALQRGGRGLPLLLQSEFPLPQDPIMNPDFKETFTMYSRPSAFGPPVAGRPTGSFATRNIISSGSENEPQHGFFTSSFERSAHDSFVGINPAFTPPYYDGEAWVDLIFRPQSGIAYDLERILSETKTYSWRFDAGPPIQMSGSDTFRSKLPKPGLPALIPVQMREGTNAGIVNSDSPNDDNTVPSPYDGLRINVNSMQLTSSLDIFGVERVLEENNAGLVTNKTVGQRWLIRPKWETPMLNFSDTNQNSNPVSVSNNTLTLPNFFSESVPRGMWHQFGTIPISRKVGIFMEIQEIPLQWLRNHYLVNHTGSVYNNFNVSRTNRVYKNVKSLSRLCGFNRTNNEKKLGELANELTVSEAIVAIPYISMPIKKEIRSSLKNTSKAAAATKKFINIPPKIWRSALSDAPDRSIVGESLIKLKNSMEKFVFPPQFDCVHNRVRPVAMYVFEFNYKFDKDDLSYMWQNLAPRNYKKLSFQSSTVSHNLANNELINSEILSTPGLRWMVFKVKQRAKTDYYDLLVDQAGEATTQIKPNSKTPGLRNFDVSSGKQLKHRKKYPIHFNWPYDYLSFVELIKLDVDVLLKNDE